LGRSIELFIKSGIKTADNSSRAYTELGPAGKETVPIVSRSDILFFVLFDKQKNVLYRISLCINISCKLFGIQTESMKK